MKKLLFLVITIQLLLSCNNEKVESSKLTHLNIFNLNGKVKEMDFSYFESEITDLSYKPIGKACPYFYSMIENIDLSHNVALSDFNKYSLNTVFDSFNLSLLEINSGSLKSSLCNDFKIEFNEDGFLTSFKGDLNNSEYFKIRMLYNKSNQLVEVIHEEDGNKIYNYKKTFEYNDNELLKKRTEIYTKFTDVYEYNYTFNKDHNEILVNEIKNNNLNKAQQYLIKLNDDMTLNRITYKKEGSIIKFLNGIIVDKKEFDKGITTYDTNLIYKDNLLMNVKLTSYNFLKDFKFDYDKYGNIVSLTSNNEKDFNFLTNLVFDYKFDVKNNWITQNYYLKRDIYEKALKKENENEKFEDALNSLYPGSLSIYNEEILKRKIGFEILKKQSSKITVERVIQYF